NVAPTRRTTRASPTTTTTTTPVTNAQLKVLIEQGVSDAMAARDAGRSQNGEDSHDSRTTENCVPYTQLHCGKPYQVFHLYSSWKCSNVVELPRKTVGHDVAYAMTWKNLKKKITDKYCLRGEIKKLKVEMWSLKVKGTDVRYVGGLLDMIHESVMASMPKTMQDAVEFATELMDKKIYTFAERQTENKRKQDDNQPQENKRQNTGRAYAVMPGEKKPYGGSNPLCFKCNYHHDGPCAPKCHKCNRVGHLDCDYRSRAATNNQRNLACFECGNQRHYRIICPKLKNQNHGNQAREYGTNKKNHRASPARKTTTTLVINAQLKALISQGVADVLVARDTDRSQNGKDNHDSRTGVRRQAPFARECTYPDFMK
nr:hypothetical protein [Tanacetum cinerariifolium]